MIEVNMNKERTECIRFDISEFKGTEYLSIRKWYRANGQDDGVINNANTWYPTKDGCSASIERNSSHPEFMAIVDIVKASSDKEYGDNTKTDMQENKPLEIEDIPF